MNSAQTAQWLREHDNYLILTHRRPDGDTVGSAAALCRGLRAFGKKAEIFPNTQFFDKFQPLLEDLLGTGDPEGKTVISVDLAAENMLPYNALGLAGRTAFSIDHHSSNSGYAENTWMEPAASCGELIFDLLQELGISPDEKTAEAIYVAVSTDTGCFRYDSTTPHTLRVAAACLEAGANAEFWNRVLFLTRTQARIRLESCLIQTAEFFMDGRVALCLLPRSAIEACGAKEEELDDISGFARDISGVEIGILIRDVADGAKISMRTYKPWNASAICALLGGGGHPAAAGATVPGTLSEARTAVLNALRQSGVEV